MERPRLNVPEQGCDAWGNLLEKQISKCSAENLSVSADSKNQIHTGGIPDYAYDAAGNMTYDASTGNSYSYDAENRITGAGGFTYTYDADGSRVEKSNGSTGTIYWSMSPGIVAESDLSGNLQSEYVFFDGRRVARKDFSGNATLVSYYFSDHLGTASVITNSAGTITVDEDFYPWGGELRFVSSDSNRYKFSGKERDAETGLDYFGARYYGNWLGRFATPDDFLKDSHVGDPQSWNKYAYARNNPLRYTDPTGEKVNVAISCSSDGETCQVNITASIAFYPESGSDISSDQMNQAAADIKSQIESAWSGTYQQDGVSYNVSTTVNVEVSADEGSALKTGAQNVIALKDGVANEARVFGFSCLLPLDIQLWTRPGRVEYRFDKRRSTDPRVYTSPRGRGPSRGPEYFQHIRATL